MSSGVKCLLQQCGIVLLPRNPNSKASLKISHILNDNLKKINWEDNKNQRCGEGFRTEIFLYGIITLYHYSLVMVHRMYRANTESFSVKEYLSILIQLQQIYHANMILKTRIN